MDQSHTHFKPFQLAALAGLSLLLTACGSQFEASRVGQAELAASYETPSIDLKTYLAELEAIPAESNTSRVSGEAKVQFVKDFAIPFGTVSKVLGYGESLAKTMIWPACNTGFQAYLPQNPSPYACGELPLGKVLSSSEKELLVVPFEGLSGEMDGVEYTVSDAVVPVRMARLQRSSQESLNLLDTKSISSHVVPSELLEATYFRLRPKGGELEVDICFYSPGLEIYSQTTQIGVRAKKDVLFLDLKGSADITVNPGRMKFDSARVCATLSAQVSPDGKTKVQIKNVQAPLFKGLMHEGLKVSVDVEPEGILKFISGVLKVVGVNLEKKIEQKARESIQEQVRNITQDLIAGKIQSGEWFQEFLHQKGYANGVIKSLEADIGRYFKNYGPGSESQLRSWFKAACSTLAMREPTTLTKRLELLCHQRVEIKAHLFMPDDSSQSQQCYEHYFSPLTSSQVKTKWWAKNCRIQNKIEIVAPESLSPLYSCIADILNRDPKLLKDPQSCRTELNLLVENIRLDDHFDSLGRIMDPLPSLGLDATLEFKRFESEIFTEFFQ